MNCTLSISCAVSGLSVIGRTTRWGPNTSSNNSFCWRSINSLQITNILSTSIYPNTTSCTRLHTISIVRCANLKATASVVKWEQTWHRSVQSYRMCVGRARAQWTAPRGRFAAAVARATRAGRSHSERPAVGHQRESESSIGERGTRRVAAILKKSFSTHIQYNL